MATRSPGRTELEQTLETLRADLAELEEQVGTLIGTGGSNPYHRAQRLLELEKRKASLLGGAARDSVTWRMLLELFVCTHEGRRCDMTSLCIASAAPHATALRRIHQLIDGGIVLAIPDATDGRRTYLDLNPAHAKDIVRLLT